MINPWRRGIFIWEDTSVTDARHVFITYASVRAKEGPGGRNLFDYKQSAFSVALGPPGGALDHIKRINDFDQDGTPDDATLLQLANMFVAMNIHPVLYP